MISRTLLLDIYQRRKLSVSTIAKMLDCSQSKVNYWLDKHSIKKRTISEAIYSYKNPHGDPFLFKKISTKEEWFLLGLGIGLFWGEGTKSDKNAIRLGNSDPHLVKWFLIYLEKVYGVSRSQCKFGLQVFETDDCKKIMTFWGHVLGVPRKNFYSPIIKKKTAKGSYNRFVEHGVLTVYFNNTKLRNTFLAQLENMKKADIITDVLLKTLHKPM